MAHMKRGLGQTSRFTLITLGVGLFMVPMTAWCQSPTPSFPAKSAGKADPGTAEKPLTLEDAIILALDRQPRLRAALERVKAQRAVVGQAKSAYYPTIDLNTSFRRSTSSGGGDVGGLDARNRYSSATNLNWTIYDFGKREGSVRGERDSLDATQYAQRTSAEDVVLAVKQAYYRYLQITVLVRVREDTVKDRELLVRQAKGFFEVGTRPKIDVVRAESNLFLAQADLITAQNAVRVGWARLKNAIGVRKFPQRPLAEEALLERPVEELTKELGIQKPPVSLDAARETAFNLRPELKDFEAQLRAQDAAIDTARRGHLPDFLLSSRYGRRGGDSPNQLTDEDWEIALRFNIPIFSGFQTTYEVQEASSNFYEIKAREEELRQQIALEVEQSYFSLVGAGERLKATDSAVRAAKENLDLANGRYRVGVGSIIEITEAQVISTQAQTDHIQTIADYKIFEADLARAMGQGILR
jgi:outer membrane protein TolC